MAYLGEKKNHLRCFCRCLPGVLSQKHGEKVHVYMKTHHHGKLKTHFCFCSHRFEFMSTETHLAFWSVIFQLDYFPSSADDNMSIMLTDFLPVKPPSSQQTCPSCWQFLVPVFNQMFSFTLTEQEGQCACLVIGSCRFITYWNGTQLSRI